MNTADLRTSYPLITNKHNNILWTLEKLLFFSKDLIEPSTNIDDEETEINYLRELGLLLKL